MLKIVKKKSKLVKFFKEKLKIGVGLERSFSLSCSYKLPSSLYDDDLRNNLKFELIR